MRRFFFLAAFTSPQEGPSCMPIFPFDKVEVVQGTTSIYPPAPADTCIVSVECQEHTAIVDLVVTEDPLWPSQKAMLLSRLEPQMESARAEMAALYPYLGVEDYA